MKTASGQRLDERLIYIRSLVTPARKFSEICVEGASHSKKPSTTAVTLFARNRLIINKVDHIARYHQFTLHHVTWSLLRPRIISMFTPIAPLPSNSEEKYRKKTLYSFIINQLRKTLAWMPRPVQSGHQPAISFPHSFSVVHMSNVTRASLSWANEVTRSTSILLLSTWNI